MRLRRRAGVPASRRGAPLGGPLSNTPSGDRKIIVVEEEAERVRTSVDRGSGPKFSKTTVHGRDMATGQMAGTRALGRSEEKSFLAAPARPQMGHE